MTNVVDINKSNITNDTTKQYIFLPIDIATKTGFFLFYGLFFLLGMTGNILLLIAVRKVQAEKRRRPRQALGRSLTLVFLSNLAICNFLWSISSLLNGLRRYIDMFTSDWACMGLLLAPYSLSFINTFNLVIIAFERYFAIFHPTKLPSSSTIKKLLLLAWFSGIVISPGAVQTVKIVYIDYSPTQYTLGCRQVVDTIMKNIFATLTFLLTFHIPNIIMITIAIKTMEFLKKRRKKVMDGNPGFLDKAHAWRFKDTRMFMVIFITFALPYTVQTIHVILIGILKLHISYYNSYILANISGVVGYSNCILVPALSFASNRGFRKAIMKICKQRDAKRQEQYSIQ
ncbi:predicted protein [Nematostella vectensis]|uniref:G-protein coupled receptors family 1 profile domain-containing protein n=1 Tax=Nematostella vectensis TaxID=45351 RepID=A7T159_NEMVE|nr:predicted protein [Nematostella vectensis]|eukprot:XP_001622403.1 hypothetical protein NEMVEDRAFT_v1g220759 [Nematostella vectensis]